MKKWKEWSRMAKFWEKEEILHHGVSTCGGCAMELVGRTILKVVGRRAMIVIPPGCAALLVGYGLGTGLKIPGFQCNLEATAAYLTGIRAGLNAQGKKDIHLIGFAGDGATVDIGLQALSGAAERGEKIIYICYDNEAYMNTGIQGSGSTPTGAWTTTTPGGNKGKVKDMPRILEAHGIPYIATASAGYIPDLVKKVETAMTIDGTCFIHVHAPCNAGWGFKTKDMITVARLAVETGLWSLYEIKYGEKRITRNIKERKPVTEYLRRQKRFARLTDEEIAAIQERVDKQFETA
jgi:pyruvate/2-oxoacid:ferredoxin oxidoreductase beta subunit